jgi:hypothetical protein
VHAASDAAGRPHQTNFQILLEKEFQAVRPS